MATTINGGTGIDKIQDAVVTDGKLNLSANSQAIKDALNAGGLAPIYACRAWVNFNGTGTVAIRASGNVSSITDNGVGDYTVNFTTAMPDANYTYVGSNTYTTGDVSTYSLKTRAASDILSTSIRVLSTAIATGSSLSDCSAGMVSIFR